MFTKSPQTSYAFSINFWQQSQYQARLTSIPKRMITLVFSKRLIILRFILSLVHIHVSCSLPTHLRPLLVQTQGTQPFKLFIQVYDNNSHQQYENVTIEVSHSSMFKNHSSLSIINSYNKHKTKKTAGAVILQLALKLQKENNFPVIPI